MSAFISVSEVQVGDETSGGTVTAIRRSASGKTIYFTYAGRGRSRPRVTRRGRPQRHRSFREDRIMSYPQDDFKTQHGITAEEYAAITNHLVTSAADSDRYTVKTDPHECDDECGWCVAYAALRHEFVAGITEAIVNAVASGVQPDDIRADFEAVLSIHEDMS
jgi:hypothetical protein